MSFHCFIVGHRPAISIIRLAVLILVLSAAVVAAEEPLPDTTKSERRWHLETVGPAGSMIFGAADSSAMLIIQAGFGIRMDFTEVWEVGGAFKIGVVEDTPDLFSTKRTMSPYLNAMLTGVCHLPWKTDFLSADAILTVSGGRMTDKFLSTFQTVIGAEIDLTLKRDTDGSPFLYVFVMPGYGVDWERNVDRGFCSIGVGVLRWVHISFDVATLFQPASGIMNPGRLK
jgi:hypothetical protein